MRIAPAALSLEMLLSILPGPAMAQRPVTLRETIEVALARGPRIAIAQADSAIAKARLTSARAFPNPDLVLDYSESPPLYHAEIEQPLEYPGARSARTRAARFSLVASKYELAAERAALRYDVQVAYVHASGARSILVLSERNARDAAELLRITEDREDAGDASELDVSLASVFAGQAQNEAFTDSLETITTALELQALMGLSTSTVEIVAADSIEALTSSRAKAPEPLRVAAAAARARSDQANVDLARSSRIPALALRGGIETGDPSGDDEEIFSTFGVTLPLPLWNRHRGEVDEAQALAASTEAELKLAELETRAALEIARRQRDVAELKVDRGRSVVKSAELVAELAIKAYRDGAYPLASVLEAQRNARDVLREFIHDLEARGIAQFAFERAQIVGGSQP